MFEYKVVHQILIEEFNTEKLERVLTKNSKEGWILDFITKTDTYGFLIIFKRPILK